MMMHHWFKEDWKAFLIPYEDLMPLGQTFQLWKQWSILGSQPKILWIHYAKENMSKLWFPIAYYKERISRSIAEPPRLSQ